MISSFFVYGTLQRGGVRCRHWPRPPLAIEAGTIRARLYDLGPYPAIGPGDALVAGELWRIAADDLALTLRTLDEVEGFEQPGEVDLYRRAAVECTLGDGRRESAWVYWYSRTGELAAAREIPPEADGVCRWRP